MSKWCSMLTAMQLCRFFGSETVEISPRQLIQIFGTYCSITLPFVVLERGRVLPRGNING